MIASMRGVHATNIHIVTSWDDPARSLYVLRFVEQTTVR
jgi:hypothetical protein